MDAIRTLPAEAGRRCPRKQVLARLRQLVWACVPVLLCLLPLRSHALESVSVQLSWSHQFQFAGYYVALARGHYRAEGFDVELRAGGFGSADPKDAVMLGRAEFGVTNSDLAVSRMAGKPLVALAAVLQESALVWMAQRPPGDDRTGLRAPSGKDLARLARGRVAWRGDLDRQAELVLPLDAVGVNLRQLSQSIPPDPVDQFVAGQIDLMAGYRTNELLDLKRRGHPVSVIELDRSVPGFYSEILFTSQALAERSPQRIERFRRATLRGWQEAFDDIEGTARMIQRLYATQHSVDQLVAEGREMERLSRRDDIELGHMSRSHWERVAAQQVRLGLAPADGLGRIDGLLWGPHSEPVQLLPDPMRVALTGVVAALWLTVFGLWRIAAKGRAEVERLQQAQARQGDDDLRFQFLMDVAPFPVLMFGIRDGQVSYANERAIGALGLVNGTAQWLIHDSLPALRPGGDLMQRLQSSRILRDVELERPGVGAEAAHWSLLTMRAVEYEGKPCAFAAAVDITLRKRAEIELTLLSAQRGRIIEEVEQLQAKLRDASVRDPLTGLFNRRYLDATLRRELHRAHREGRPLSLMVVDADHFKRVNDHYGHAGGDEVLRQIARVLQDSHRSEDVVCRFGGEEFVVVLPGSDLTFAAERAESLRRMVESLAIPTDGGFAHITISIGVTATWPGDDADKLFKRADAAVYEAKRSGRNRVVVFSAAAPDEAPTHLAPAGGAMSDPGLGGGT
ncbi:GGDEF domain-containing protein [Sphaerotilus mobilis]|uniref:diguanylate cyclase n=1 Tax=Sphaerotilus mobilis TaxID=47994 RepID=A0A4Q7LUP4_9BURK|nr:GGDEF domain-containing protein [Sphaerotilus mobilis]RZS58281.1 diguanylate cyclase (GGDEF)-like protein [Sphaerotilus mobilis]